MTNLDDLLKFNYLTHFKRDQYGREFSHLLGTITLSWGVIETYLFWILYSINASNGKHFARELFRRTNLHQKKEYVREVVTPEVLTSYPDFLTALDKLLDDLQSIQNQRNPLAHGLWVANGADDSFDVLPLGIEKASNDFRDKVRVDLKYLTKLIGDMNNLNQGLASLASEMLAHQWLKKHDPGYITKV